MRGKLHFEARPPGNENPQNGSMSTETDNKTIDLKNSEYCRDGAISKMFSPDSNTESAAEQALIEHQKCGAPESSSDQRATEGGHQCVSKVQALVPVLACHVCYNAGTRSFTRSIFIALCSLLLGLRGSLAIIFEPPENGINTSALLHHEKNWAS